MKLLLSIFGNCLHWHKTSLLETMTCFLAVAHFSLASFVALLPLKDRGEIIRNYFEYLYPLWLLHILFFLLLLWGSDSLRCSFPIRLRSDSHFSSFSTSSDLSWLVFLFISFTIILVVGWCKKDMWFHKIIYIYYQRKL